ncbi:MAG: hypothetical protein LLF95_02855 [Bacteroidales bacterium]|nr:hypothetical protein [Bacteroidales bacterium]
MKKLLSILFATMILLSGMHLSLATHICGGEIAGVRLSFTQQKTNCEMEIPGETTPIHNGISPAACCQDQMALYAVDKNYSPSTSQINQPVNHVLQVFYIPETIGMQFSNTPSSVNANVQPPGKFLASAVSLPYICIFRI